MTGYENEPDYGGPDVSRTFGVIALILAFVGGAAFYFDLFRRLWALF